MDFISDEERAAHSERRIMIYNQIQMVLGGQDPLAAIAALCDALAVTVVQVCGADRAASQNLFDRLAPDIKRSVDNNLDLVREQMELSAKLGAASRVAGIA